MKKNIRDIFDSHVQALIAGMQSYRKAGRLKTMHDMRVDMKSIRSVFFMLEKAGPHGRAQKHHRRVKKIFAVAGQIREWQLEARWLRQHKKLALLRLLRYDALIREANMDFQEKTRAHIRSLRDIRKAGDSMLKKMREPQIHRYLGALLNSVVQSCDAALPMLEWHDLRKWIKRLLHARLWLLANRPETPAVNQFCDDIEKLQASIGNWHDLHLLENRLHESASQIRPHANAWHEAKAAAKTLQAEKAKLEIKIRQLLTVMQKRWNRAPAIS
jgi:CHAD domain-containing protein